LGFANLLVPYNESIHFEVGYNIGKNLADVIADFTSLLYLLAPYVAYAFLLMRCVHTERVIWTGRQFVWQRLKYHTRCSVLRIIGSSWRIMRTLNTSPPRFVVSAIAAASRLLSDEEADVTVMAVAWKHRAHNTQLSSNAQSLRYP